MLRFNARGPDGLLDGKSPGQPPKLNDVSHLRLLEMKSSVCVSTVSIVGGRARGIHFAKA
jgi:hypothetical protein